MNRNQLEHIIRAACDIAGESRLVIVGSQAILASEVSPPTELTVSIEADVFPLDNPEKADLIEGCIGELSPFHEQYGYYAHGVGQDTAILPSRWRERLVPLQNENTRGYIGLCLGPGDLAVSKILAGRPKDMAYVQTLIVKGFVTTDDLKNLLSELGPADRKRLNSFIATVR